MEINFVVIAIAVVAVIAIVFWVIKKNQKDRIDFETELNQKELRPDKHDDEHI